MEIRLLRDGDNTAEFNMAADESLLILHSNRIIPPTLRLWSFSRPVVAVGRFSKVNEAVNTSITEKLGISIVRRFTGGGVTFNDSEGDIGWTFVSAGDNVIEKYGEIAKAIAYAMSKFGIQAYMNNISDIFCNGKKISGLAAAKSKESVLVHGTLLYSPRLKVMDEVLKKMPDSNGNLVRPSNRVTTLNRILKRTLSREEIYDALEIGFSRFGSIGLGEHSPLELDLISRLSGRYRDRSWTFRR